MGSLQSGRRLRKLSSEMEMKFIAGNRRGAIESLPPSEKVYLDFLQTNKRTALELGRVFKHAGKSSRRPIRDKHAPTLSLIGNGKKLDILMWQR